MKIKAKAIQIIENTAKKIPAVQRLLEKEYNKLLSEIEESAKPYKDLESFPVIPQKGIEREDILQKMIGFQEKEQDKWKDGFVSGAVYHGDNEHIEFLNKVLAINSQSNPLHSDVWPSAAKYEAEIVSMTGNMMNGHAVTGKDEVCGTVSSGGTESIMLAMKTYRDWARDKKGIKKPEMIVPITAHAAFDKASQYFGIKMRHVSVDHNYQANVKEVKKTVNKNTIVIVGSAPAFPHGIIDPIKELSEIARKRKIGFHVDACLGGFLLPWAEKLGYDVPVFDFRLPGVTSISADTHKYGYTAKGTSVILYRNLELRHYQYYTATEWPGGLYFSPTFAGSRPGSLSAACWASMLSIGEEGYLKSTKKIVVTADKIKKAISEIPELYILGKPLWVISFGSEVLDIYKVLDAMAKRKWSLNGLHKPSALHIAITLRHTQNGVAGQFIKDLKESVAYVKTQPKTKGGMAPMYGLAASIPFRGAISDLLKRYLDILYKV
ncbi:MAG: aspartate aminotransferase family protein [Bacteroidetes bacterium 4572_117]|nr:MAG: aspartate aminotransferase family protein [Bacteroidetes bacterium 4572_117]